jgi:hypothetical protein
MDTDNSHLFPFRSELACKSLFAKSEEERLLSRLLLSQTVEGRDEEHPWVTLERLYPPGSEAEKAMFETPAGKVVKQFLDAQPDENNPEDFPVEFVEEFEQMISTKPVVPPAEPSKAETDLADLAARTSFSARLNQHGLEGPKIEKPKVALPESDWGFGSGTIL